MFEKHVRTKEDTSRVELPEIRENRINFFRQTSVKFINRTRFLKSVCLPQLSVSHGSHENLWMVVSELSWRRIQNLAKHLRRSVLQKMLNGFQSLAILAICFISYVSSEYLCLTFSGEIEMEQWDIGLTHLLPMHPFFYPLKTSENCRVF